MSTVACSGSCRLSHRPGRLPGLHSRSTLQPRLSKDSWHSSKKIGEERARLLLGSLGASVELRVQPSDIPNVSERLRHATKLAPLRHAHAAQFSRGRDGFQYSCSVAWPESPSAAALSFQLITTTLPHRYTMRHRSSCDVAGSGRGCARSRAPMESSQQHVRRRNVLFSTDRIFATILVLIS